MNMNPDFMAKFRDAFLEESTDLVDAMETILLRLDPVRVEAEDLNTIFRVAHSIKGNGGTFGFPAITAFAHDVEGVLERARRGEITLTAPLVAKLLGVVDLFRRHLDLARAGAALPEDLAAAQAQLIADLRHLAAGGTSEGEAPPPPQAPAAPGWGYRIRFAAPPATFRRGLNLERIFRDLERLGTAEFTLLPEGLPALEDVDPETCYLAWDIRLRTRASRTEVEETFEFVAEGENLRIEALEAPDARSLPSPVPPATSLPIPPLGPARAPRRELSETPTVRVATEKIDGLMNLVGELVITQAMLAQSSALLDTPQGQARFQEALQHLARQTRELQEGVMGIRMVPMELVFSRFPRLVRDLGQQLGKEADLVMDGIKTELDKNFIELLVDPLTHLVRNAMDHGLETPAERSSLGKAPRGRLSLRASSRSGQVFIEVEDDGRGLDRGRILAKARERNLPLPEDPTDAQVLDLVFEPGFSTATEVSDVSGRGVGLDVVRQNLVALGGRIEVDSRPGAGTTFRLIVPLTLAILDGLLVRLGTEVFVFPLAAVLETFQPAPQALQSLQGDREVINVRGQYVPVLRLQSRLGTPSGADEAGRTLLVLVESGGRQAALVVDELLGQQQLVIKSLEAHYRRVPGISGATILGDGRVALILDLQTLLESLGREAPR